jgi:two-component system nitrate/nitrite response regulator NarL
MVDRRVRLMVVDDHEVIRLGIRSLLQHEPGVDVVASAASGEDALTVLDRVAPDVVLLDYRLPGLDGAATCAAITQRRPSTAVIMVSAFLSDEAIHACLRAGARGCLTKDVESADLSKAIRAVANGGAVLASAVADRVIEWARRAKDGPRDDSALTPEEVAVLGWVARGFSNRLIAEELCVSESTVKLRLNGAMRKLGKSRRWDAVTAGLARGVI